MKKLYNSPFMEFEKYNVEDVMTISNFEFDLDDTVDPGMKDNY